MLSRTKIKFIKSLQLKKYRKAEQCFVVEGAKAIRELLTSDFETVLLACTEGFLEGSIRHVGPETEVVSVSQRELAQLGTLDSNDAGLAVVKMKTPRPLPLASDQFILALDAIRDPGNLGTIIRTADWFGITTVVASPDSVDLYNSKVIQATMGSFLRVGVWYEELSSVLQRYSMPVFGCFLEGEDIHTLDFGESGIVIIGNESKGIDPQLHSYINQRISIPRYGNAESLNAAAATAVVCDNIRRNSHKKR